MSFRFVLHETLGFILIKHFQREIICSHQNVQVGI